MIIIVLLNTLENIWRRPSLRNEIKSTKIEPLKIEQNENSLLNPNQNGEIFPSRWSNSMNMFDNKSQSRSTSPDNFNPIASSSPTRSRANITLSPIGKAILPSNKFQTAETRRTNVKLPVRSNSLPQSKTSDSNRTTEEKFDCPNLLQTFMTNDRCSQPSPISHSRMLSSSVNNHQQLSSSDDDNEDDVETNQLKEDDLKRKLKEEKRQSKRTSEILNKLHENYEELLEKYAQAENTIDQLRFQSNSNKPPSRSSGICHSIIDSPFPSMRPVSPLTKSAVKSMSSANSCTIDSVFYDENVSQKNCTQNLAIPETVKLDLLIQSKTLGDNMKSFLTLMDANQVNEAEQKQVYENIKQDYEKLIQTLERKKQNSNLNDVDPDGDLNKELELMKQLLKEIATRITGNLFGKSNNNSPIDRNTHPTYDDSHSSQYDRSSLCNHDDLMDQYKKLLTAVNTENTDKTDRLKSMMNELETDFKKSKTTSPHILPSDLFNDQIVTDNKQKPYVYTSAGSDDEHPQSANISPIPFTKGVESTSSELNYIPSSSVQKHQHTIQEEPHKSNMTTVVAKKTRILNKQEYHRLGDILRPKEKENIDNIEDIKESSSLLITDRTRNSNSSSKTRAHDCDSGIGTNTVTKFTLDSKHSTSPMDESQLQSLDEGQASISSSLRSTGSDSESLYGKYIKKFTHPTLRPKKSYQQSDSGASEIETYVTTHPFDSLNKKMHRSNQIWKLQRKSSPQRSRFALFHRSVSIGHGDIEKYKPKSHQPLIATEIPSKIDTKQEDSIPTTHRSSLVINHTQDKTKQDSPAKFFVDSQKGVVYRYRFNKTQNPIKIDQQKSIQKKIYRCGKCGNATPYHHRHYANSVSRETVATQADDLGYESGHRKRSQSCRYTDSTSSSDSDSDLSTNYLQMIALNEAYERAEKVENCSHRLSRYITRQLKLALTLI
ncbi:hypothetical protein I4U23_001849 [Adineta vaga]|nr:hypothetical protein I4U23_001849 [Adineta vaga]